MTSINLTRTEARSRTERLNMDHYDIALDLTGGPKTFSSITDVHFLVKKPGTTFIDLRAKSVEEVILDGVNITQDAVTVDDTGAYVEEGGLILPNLATGFHHLTVTATCLYSRTGQGLHRYVDPADHQTYLYTQFETADAKRMFACFDQPDLKASHTLTVKAPADWRIITNGEAELIDDKLETKTWRSKVNYRMSTYLYALCAGPYFEARDTWSGQLHHHPETPAGQPTDLSIPLGIYCRQSLAKHLDAERLFEETKQGFTFYHENFGIAYPFGKYDQVFVPEFNMGAMENAGCVTHRDEYVFTSKQTHAIYERRCDTILHEMAHMWFGDLVTMRWWDDLWLNESFATWSAAVSQAEATAYDTAWVTFAQSEKGWAYQQDQLPSTHPITADATDIETVEQNFDGITYAKGASVLKQLAAYVGREAFLAGVRRHFATHAFGNATFDDLLAALSAASGRDLTGWASQWLTTTGINVLIPDFTVSEQGTYETFVIHQKGARPGNGECRDHRLAVGLYNLNKETGKVERTKRVELDITGHETKVEELLGEKKADLVLVNDDDLTYCMAELDPDSLAFVREHIGDIIDPMPRILCWSAAWQMVRNGQMKARDYVDLVAHGASKETENSVLVRILQLVSQAVRTFADPNWVQTTGKDKLAHLLLDGVEASEPGSDNQLAFAQSLTAVEPNDRALTFLREIQKGNSPVEGLVADHDLRWRATVALIAAGDITDPTAAITAMQKLDNTSDGQKWAWTATAAINTEENKKKNFDRVFTKQDDLSNLEARHRCHGLMWAGSDANLQQFTDHYFEIAPTVWKELPSELALPILEMIFPFWACNEKTLAKADKLIQNSTGGLLRIMSEHRDTMSRRLRNREVDAS